MIVLDPTELALVYGGEAGPNGNALDTPILDSSSTRSNYGYCVDAVKQETAKAYPDTRPSILGLPLPFTTDDNATKRANATMDNMLTVCGAPPP